MFYFQPTLLESSASVVLYPFIVIQNIVTYPFRVTYNYISDIRFAVNNLHSVQAQLADAQEELTALYATSDYHEHIQELTCFQYQYDMSNALCVQVILRDCSPQTQTCYLNAGSARGVTQNMIAVYKNSLLGRIDEVYPLYSKLIYTTDPRCKVAVYTHKTKANGIAQGIGHDNKLALRFVNHLETLHVGDLVFSSGQGFIFPRGFALGTVEHFQDKGVEYECEIVPLQQPSSIDFCYLIAKGQ